MCLACAMVSEGKESGLNAHVKTKGSGFSLKLSSERSVWLNNFKVQPGLSAIGWWFGCGLGSDYHFCMILGWCVDTLK
jgi:hypothetical protein